MSYPFWDTSIGYGLLMGCIAVFHVFISHFAIGGGLYLVITEAKARKHDDTERLTYLQRLSKFFVLTTVVMGAVTGVGIWVIIGLLNPAATEVLIHNFVWGWATEWTFFVIEITAAILYYYGWRRMSAKSHLALGWIYFAAAWLSLVIINGIIDFMLTPGDWLTTGSFWDGFFNPTYWPALVFRTGICVMLAGLYAMLIASKYEAGDFKAKLVRYNAAWGLVGLVILLPSFYWYWHAVPQDLMQTAREMMTFPFAAIQLSYWFAGAIAVLLILFGFIFSRRLPFVVAVLFLIAGILYFGSFEWWRESLRKPYVIHDYMYGNGVELAKVDTYNSEGYLSQITYRTGDDAADLFRHACRSCHTINGYKALKPHFDGTDEAFIEGCLAGLQVMKGNMPPFEGTAAERHLIATYLYARTDHRSLSEIYGLKGVELGRKVYEIRCGKCHVLGGFNDKTESLAGLTDEDYNDLLDNAGDIADEMPAFTGSQQEREALIAFLKTLGKGDS
ncbi:MAG: hypothetical protein D6800_05370, partial [Candidatus Zixiibacteriota bacterium]